jgi:MraZ protein
LFVGTFEHSLDDKGRVVLPATFRSHLADSGVLTQFDACLALWTNDGFTSVAQRLTDKIRETQAPQEAIRAFAANAHEVRPDSQGRITIPQRLRDFAGLDRDVVVIGAIERIEIWDAARWQEVSSTADASLSEAVRVLGL